MSPDTKQILDQAMDRPESLGLDCRFESAHLPLSLPSWLMREFDAIVGVAARVMIHGRQHGSESSSIALQFVGDNPKWFMSLAAQ